METSRELTDYRYRGARACVLLHERYLREFLDVWHEAKASNLTLPKSKDKAYQSLEHLLFHVLRCGRSYMVWMCEKLNLPDPKIDEPPALDEVGSKSEIYVQHLLERWRSPLKNITEPESEKTFPSRWGVEYAIDAMLEHAVMHPIRHSFQLRELMTRGNK